MQKSGNDLRQQKRANIERWKKWGEILYIVYVYVYNYMTHMWKRYHLYDQYRFESVCLKSIENQ